MVCNVAALIARRQYRHEGSLSPMGPREDAELVVSRPITRVSDHCIFVILKRLNNFPRHECKQRSTDSSEIPRNILVGHHGSSSHYCTLKSSKQVQAKSLWYTREQWRPDDEGRNLRSPFYGKFWTQARADCSRKGKLA